MNLQTDTVQPIVATAQAQSAYTVVGGVSQLSCRKPLSTFFPYDLIICKEGLLFVKESFGEVMKVAGVLGAGSSFGLLGYFLSSKSAGSSMNRALSQVSTPEVIPTAIANPKNFWLPVGKISQITIQRSTFVHKLTINLRDGAILKCGSKARYNQFGNMQTYLKQSFSELIREM